MNRDLVAGLDAEIVRLGDRLDKLVAARDALMQNLDGPVNVTRKARPLLIEGPKSGKVARPAKKQAARKTARTPRPGAEKSMAYEVNDRTIEVTPEQHALLEALMAAPDEDYVPGPQLHALFGGSKGRFTRAVADLERPLAEAGALIEGRKSKGFRFRNVE